MRTLLFLALCLPAYAAPLPPLPAIPTVKRTPPLVSPKAAAAQKSKAMVKAVGFTPASVPGFEPIWVSFTKDFNFFHCNTNESDCILYDITTVQTIQRAGKGLRVEYCDSLPNPGTWAFAAEWGSYQEEIQVGFTWFHTTSQRPAMRLFRAVPIEAMVPAAVRSGVMTPDIKVNPSLKGLAVWSRPLKK